jgi:hypothetical protein
MAKGLVDTATLTLKRERISRLASTRTPSAVRLSAIAAARFNGFS